MRKRQNRKREKQELTESVEQVREEIRKRAYERRRCSRFRAEARFRRSWSKASVTCGGRLPGSSPSCTRNLNLRTYAMGREADVTAADGISHAGVLPELATDAATGRWSHHFGCPVGCPFTAQERDHVHHFVWRVDVEARTVHPRGIPGVWLPFPASSESHTLELHLGRNFGNSK